LFHFTGSQRDFEWGLYTRNVTGGKRVGYARLGDKTTQLTMTLHPGVYQLMMRVSNWNCSNFSPVTVAVEKASGQNVFEETFTPTSNVGNAASNDFSGTELKSLSFEIQEKGRYFLTFYTADAAWADLVVGQVALRRTGNLSAVAQPKASTPVHTYYYNMSGQRVNEVRRGMYIEQTVTADGQVHNRVRMK
jgi:hypothetical protein